MTHPDRHDRARWLASGLPDAVITIMFRDGTLPPPHAARWYDSSLSTDEISEFRRSGRPAPDAAFAASLEARGLPTDVEFVDRWEGYDASTILDAIDRGFTSGDQFSAWSRTDADIVEVEQLVAAGAVGGDSSLTPAKALSHLRSGRSPEQVAFAGVSGIKVKRAVAWMEHGLSASTAAAWSRDAGFAAPAAARWIDVVDDPEVARLLETLGFDVDTASRERPEGGWTRQVVRRRVATDAGAPADLAEEWAATSLPDRKLAKWVAAGGVSPSDADAWLGAGFRPGDAAAWSTRGSAPSDADAWRTSGVDPDVAARRRDAGVRPPTAS